ncbi:MAG: 50S ribosomal protein L14 [Candidatus Pacebacteria bacterium]|nr:50S ribosomal protein L14 [Candidatus Paceibacterota bacterium]
MLQAGTNVKITDNTGAKLGRIFKVLGGSKRRYASIGDLVCLSIKVADPRKQVKKKDVVYGIVVRTSKEFRRKDGSYIRFDDNAVVIVDKVKKDPKATRIFGPIPKEISENKNENIRKIATMAPEVI